VELLPTTVLVAALLCSLVAGFLFAYAVVVMPGFRRLDDASFIRAFQVTDGIIQANQPLFLLVWVGSALALVVAAALGLTRLDGAQRLMLIAAACLYLVGVQAPTIAVNVPLNNALQRLDPAAMDETATRRARDAFEPRWNRWNALRTVCAVAASALLLSLLLRL
jgi:uncharacterized membrane protein